MVFSRLIGWIENPGTHLIAIGSMPKDSSMSDSESILVYQSVFLGEVLPSISGFVRSFIRSKF